MLLFFLLSGFYGNAWAASSPTYPKQPYIIGRDHLGSINVLSTGGSLQSGGNFDAWGNGSASFYINRGFCGHEHLPDFGLINMNARLYDPVLGRFLSPDPYIQAPDFPSNFNRYAYCLNNPLKYNDRTGELFGIDDAVLIAAVLTSVGSMAIDYAIQVLSNIKDANSHPEWTSKDIWVNNIDWFDIGLSGVIGALSGGYATAVKSGVTLSKFGAAFLNNIYLVELGELIATSAIDVTGSGTQKVPIEQFVLRVTIGLLTMEASQYISTKFSEQVSPENRIFFDNTEYSESAQQKMARGNNHSFPESAYFDLSGNISVQRGRDGGLYQHLVIPGYYNGSSGQFEFIKTLDGTITHRFFRPL